MSTWTHVNASIRFDCTSLDPSMLPDKILLKTRMPSGSEGPLKYQIWKCKDKTSAAGYTLNIFGDLRDYSNLDLLLQFFKDLTHGKLIRSGIIEIQVRDTITNAVYRFPHGWVVIEQQIKFTPIK